MNNEKSQEKIEYVALKVTSGVLMHIGAGIYNSIAGAIKELVSNSYDADAKNVTISMDYPSFNKIKVVDDGTGMSPRRLRQAMQTIGSSLKKLENAETTELFKRPIIGHLGIGLMALSQICRKARIESKEKGTKYKLVADLDFSQFKDREEQQMLLAKLELLTEQYGGINHIEEILNDPDIDEDYKAEVEVDLEIAKLAKDRLEELQERLGDINLQGEHLGYCIFYPEIPATENDHGTSITLTDIDKEVKDQLRDIDKDINSLPEKFKDMDQPLEAYRNDVNSWDWREICSRLQSATSGLRYSGLPYYHQFLWELALMTPVPYFDDGPLIIDKTIFSKKKQELKNYNFNLVVDKYKIRKPILLPSGAFSDNIESMVKGLDYEIRKISHEGNENQQPLKYHGYLYWQCKQNQPNMVQGLQIYIRNIGIGLYDRTLLNYDKVNPGSRIPQISGEIYIEEGLEQALSVDRSSFRETDPHFAFLKREVWKTVGVYKDGGAGLLGASVDAYYRRKEIKNEEKFKEHLVELRKIIKNTSEKPIQIKYSETDLGNVPYDFNGENFIINTSYPNWPRARQEYLFYQKILIPVKIAVDNGATGQEVLSLLQNILIGFTGENDNVA